MLDATPSPIGPPKVHCLSSAGVITIPIITSGLKIYLFVKMDLLF